MRNIFYRDDTFSLEYNYDSEGRINVHCDVFEWKLSTLKAIYREWAAFLNMNVGKVVYTVSPNPKFVKLFGGHTICVVNKNGKEYEVMTWGQD